MTTRLDWLEKTCAEVAAYRPTLAVPYLVELDGAQWTIGTDGHGLIAFREVRTDKTYDAPPMESMAGVLELRRTGADASPIDLVALKELARAAVPPAPADCKECDGLGEIACEFCRDGSNACKNCSDGLRFMPAWLGNARFNRSVLWKWLNWLTDPEAVTLWQAPDPTKARVFTGPDWFLLVMPLRTVDGAAFTDARFPWPASIAEATPA